MPANTRKVDRSTIFGNPFDVAKYGADEALRLHREWLTGAVTDEEIERRYPGIVATHLIEQRHRVFLSLAELRGMHLACWCAPARACHADLLLELVNGPPLVLSTSQSN
jgi:hypothetical protein